MLNVGKSLIEITPQGTGGGGGGTTPISVNAVSQGTIIDGINIAIDVDDKNGSPITTGSGALTITKVGNTINLDIAGNTSFQINTGGAAGTIPNWDLFDIRLRDQLGGTIVPTSVSVSGSVITINETIPYTTPISVNTASQGTITSGSNIEIDVDDKNGNPITTGSGALVITKVGNTINLDVAGNTSFQINTAGASGTIPNWDLFDIRLRDQLGGTIVPTSVSVLGSVITINETIPYTTPISVNSVYKGTITSGSNFEIDVDNKNGVPLTEGVDFTASLLGNILNLDIAGQTPLQINATPAGFLDNWDTIFIDVDDKNGTPLTQGGNFFVSIVGNTINLDIAGTTSFQINTGGAAGTIPNWDLFDIQLRDQLGGTIVPTSVSVLGSVITINETIPYTTPISVNAASQGTITSGSNIEIDVDDKNGNPITTGSGALVITKVGNTINLDVAGNTGVQVNGGGQIGTIPNWDLIDIRLRDQSANVVPITGSSFSGSNVTLSITNNPAPSGVLLQFPTPDMFQSYRTGDCGWRFQNGWYNYARPSNPAKFAELDLSTPAATYQFKLKNSLIVNGIASTTRFVDVLGGQTFPAANNCNYAVLDKLTGLLWYRQVTPLGQVNWNSAIDNPLPISVTINGVVYDEWYLPSISEYQSVWQYQYMPNDSSLFDFITSVQLISNNGLIDQMWSSVTQQANTANALTFTGEKNYIERIGKTSTIFGYTYVHKAINLIS